MARVAHQVYYLEVRPTQALKLAAVAVTHVLQDVDVVMAPA